MTKLERIFEFRTARTLTVVDVVEDMDLDLSWDEDGSTRDGLESGKYVAFGVVARCYVDGREMGGDSLWGCVYGSYREFRECKGYFGDMIRETIRETRKAITGLSDLKLRAI